MQQHVFMLLYDYVLYTFSQLEEIAFFPLLVYMRAKI